MSAAEEARREPAGEGEEREEGLVHALRERLIRIGDMDPALRALTVIALLVIVCCAALLGLRDLPLPAIPVPAGRLTVTVPLPIAAACGAFTVLAWAYIFAGALHGHLALRIGGMALCTAMMLIWASWEGALTGLVIAGLLLAPAWSLAAALWVVDARYHARSAPERHHRHHLKAPTFLFLLGVTAVPVVIVALVGVSDGSFGAFLWLQFYAVQYLLFPMLLMAGTDFAEWSEAISGRLAGLLAARGGRAVTWVTAALIVALGLYLFIDDTPFQLRPVLNLDLLLVSLQQVIPLGLMALLGWYAIRRRGAAEVPLRGMVAAGLIAYVALVAPNLPVILGRAPVSPNSLAQAAPAVWIPAVIAGVLLIRRGGQAAMAGLLIAGCAIVYLFSLGVPYWPSLLTGRQGWLVGSSLPNLARVIGFGAALLVMGMAATGRLTPRVLPLLRLVLTLLLGLVGLEFLAIVVFGSVVEAASEFTLTQALLLLVALLWDVAMSGESITNRGSRNVPRHTRVLLYFGYTMLVASWILFVDSLHGESPWVLSPFDSEQLPQLGIEIIGLPLLVTLFFGNLGTVFRGARPAEEELAPVPSTAAPDAGIAGQEPK
jgi:hypothetical protein